ncbi:Sm protein [Trichomonas vaginalis G3]|uniref:Sm protein B n=1 Tax=Trichomonas vaginalis (strain ATCC PRA-98 / G3) TaxID=412133 RepID=A2EG20_TRIV3|nr:mRNA splicing, via spliceosome [Trichomonas vaginalis G3]EAY08381.1 Sm protein [Trichomonas vaginalis G3]KAI5499339.1 mRNA splicing, via spliceosome [Trichomonas vaginalis G3]|eukprot:XP_001320604.1 Sm protein [Trichomonas vaginalis G3]
MQAPRGSKLSKFINSRVKVVISDHRYFVGQMLAFDTHSNIVLKDCEEYRRLNRRKAGELQEAKRNIGLMILRGETVLHIDIVGPPPPNGNRMSASTASSVLQPGGTPEKAKASGSGLGNLELPGQMGSLAKPAMGVGLPSSSLAASGPQILPSSKLPQ